VTSIHPHQTVKTEGSPCNGLLPLAGKLIILGVTGSIAAYKAASIARLLVKSGAAVQVILTERAKEFVGPATFAGITGRPPLTSMFTPSAGGESHVSLTASADLIVIAPATADLLARLATGRADDLLTATALCARSPLLLAPAMHPSMWSHPATRRNVLQLKADGRATFVGPERGEVASGDQGEGRMSEPDQVVAVVRTLLTPHDLSGQHIVVTAGPTVEDIDPVRFITNRSSGKMGFAIAERAQERGAKVTLIAGPVALSTPRGVDRIDVRGAMEMQHALDRVLGESLHGADALVMAAAVADYRLERVAEEKLKRDAETTTLQLSKNPDLLAGIGHRREHAHPILVGFAVETAEDDQLIALSRNKLRHKRIDVVVANRASDALGADTNRVWLVTETEQQLVSTAPKLVVADAILGWLSRALSAELDS
jgi:phosphopantothenoylcysteine decarboxylase / phosphopantothenate---cysteine ligase